MISLAQFCFHDYSYIWISDRCLADLINMNDKNVKEDLWLELQVLRGMERGYVKLPKMARAATASLRARKSRLVLLLPPVKTAEETR